MASKNTHRILRQHVETDRLLGVDAVPLGVRREVDETRSIREDASGSGTAPLSGERVAPLEHDAPGAPAHQAPPAIPPVGGTPLFAGAGAKKSPSLPREEKLRILEAMDRDEVKPCKKCDLCRSRIQTVFGEGDADARLMFIGEGPGQTEDEQGRPFVGRAGELLNKMIEAMGLKREQVYIANVVKCRPPNNRTPTPIEADTCWDYLRRQIETIRPRVIVTLGGPATKLLLNTTQGITAIRGTWHQYQSTDGGSPIPIMPTFHPAYLLRAYTVDNRKKVWSDLKKAMEVVAAE